MVQRRESGTWWTLVRPHCYWFFGATGFFAVPIVVLRVGNRERDCPSFDLLCPPGSTSAWTAAQMLSLLLLGPILLGHLGILVAQLLDRRRR